MAHMQRALWTFLIYALVGPFFAGLAVAIIVALAPVFGLGRLLPDGVPALGLAAIGTFVWSILPAVLSGLALAVVTARKGTFSWIAAAAVGILAFTVAILVFPTGFEAARPYLAFLAGIVAIAVRQVLEQASILPD